MKKTILLLIMIAAVVCFCACGEKEAKTMEEAETEKEVYEIYDIGIGGLYVWTDEETGVQYILFDGYNQGGITPRLNADGSLYTD